MSVLRTPKNIICNWKQRLKCINVEIMQARWSRDGFFNPNVKRTSKSNKNEKLHKYFLTSKN